MLVVIGATEHGQKRFLAIEDGVRESTESWRGVLRDLKNRGLRIPPKLAVTVDEFLHVLLRKGIEIGSLNAHESPAMQILDDT